MTRVLQEMRKTNRLLTKESIFTYMADQRTRYRKQGLGEQRYKKMSCDEWSCIVVVVASFFQL